MQHRRWHERAGCVGRGDDTRQFGVEGKCTTGMAAARHTVAYAVNAPHFGNGHRESRLVTNHKSVSANCQARRDHRSGEHKACYGAKKVSHYLRAITAPIRSRKVRPNSGGTQIRQLCMSHWTQAPVLFGAAADLLVRVMRSASDIVGGLSRAPHAIPPTGSMSRRAAFARIGAPPKPPMT